MTNSAAFLLCFGKEHAFKNVQIERCSINSYSFLLSYCSKGCSFVAKGNVCIKISSYFLCLYICIFSIFVLLKRRGPWQQVTLEKKPSLKDFKMK